ncbi:MAG: hypothetical protein C4521_07055 [Actinobacteria bacterium]|nr:MAG: hypothetical protein C4521_07055 [Actinomycetota bacterium]
MDLDVIPCVRRELLDLLVSLAEDLYLAPPDGFGGKQRQLQILSQYPFAQPLQFRSSWFGLPFQGLGTEVNWELDVLPCVRRKSGYSGVQLCTQCLPTLASSLRRKNRNLGSFLSNPFAQSLDGLKPLGSG